jgi:hypothetical protein
MPVTNVELKKNEFTNAIFFYLHTDVYNQISNLHTYIFVHTSMLIQHSTSVHMI